MKKGGIWLVLTAAVLLAAASGLWAEAPYRVVNGPKNLYYGHISYIEETPGGADPVVLRHGGAAEAAILNLPIGPGDTVTTSAGRRCEIQFDTGTIVRLDFSTVLRVETILAQSLSSSHGLSNLALDRGRVYVMYRAYDGREIFQLLTPVAAVKMKHSAVAVITAAEDGSTEAQITYGRSRVLFGANENRLEDREVKKGERLLIRKDSQFQLATAIEGTAFELWNKEVNAHFEDLHEGASALPKPIEKFSPAVFHFAQTYGNLYGEWLWDMYYGYVWRPFLNHGMYPWGWQPYYYGQWSYAGGQMYWVPQEPWGWIPYHLGVWQWDKKHGWVWLPGSMFAPAWATWDFFFGYACWRPLGLFDWLGYGYDPLNGGFNYTDGNWGYNWYAGVGQPRLRTDGSQVVRRGQPLPAGAVSLPAPPELKGALKKVSDAYEKGDARIRDSAAAVPDHLVFVSKGDLKSGSVHEKAVKWQEVAKTGQVPAGNSASLRRPEDARREAARIYHAGDRPSAMPPQSQDVPAAKPITTRTFVAVPQASEGKAEAPRQEGAARAAGKTGGIGRGAPEANGPAGRGSGPAARFRDWNPDIRIARDLGVRIEYSSQRNEIRCPELNLSSQQRQSGSGMAPRLTSQGISYGPASSWSGRSSGSGGSGSSGSSGGSGGSASGSSASSSTKSTGGSGSAGAAGSGGGKAGGSGTIRN